MSPSSSGSSCCSLRAREPRAYSPSCASRRSNRPRRCLALAPGRHPPTAVGSVQVMADLHHILFYDYPDDVIERRAPYREDHLELVRAWKDEGRLRMAGAIGDPPHGGVLVFKVDDPADVDEFMNADPYVKNG